MADFPEKLDEEMWEMHKLKMVELHGLPCGGVGVNAGGASEGGGGGPYRGEPLDSAREMYSEGDKQSSSKGTGTSTVDNVEAHGVSEMYVPVDEYGVPLLEPIIEASKEGVISAQASQAHISGEDSNEKLTPKPPKTAPKNANKRGAATIRAHKSQVRTLETLNEVIEDGFGLRNGPEAFKGSKSWELVNAEITRSKKNDAKSQTGMKASFWPVPDGKKYKDIRKNNWTQTDEDKDLSSMRGIFSTVDNITSQLSSASDTLEKVKYEVRTGQRESLDHELKAAHQKYRKQAQWEVDKIHRKLEAQRLAQNSLIENAVLSCKRELKAEWEQKLKEVQEPLEEANQKLKLEVKDKGKRIIELENEVDMVKQDRTHIEQKFNNLRLELEMGTYSPLVTKLRDELVAERSQSDYMKKLVTELEKDLEAVKISRHKALDDLDEANQNIRMLKAESRTLKRDLVQRVTRVEEICAAEVAALVGQKDRLEAELKSSRADFKRQVGLMDVVNRQYKEMVDRYETDIEVLEGKVQNEHNRMTSFMQKNNIPALFRKLAVSASSRKMAARTGVTDLVANLERLNQGLESVVIGIPEATKIIRDLRSPTAGRPAKKATEDNFATLGDLLEERPPLSPRRPTPPDGSDRDGAAEGPPEGSGPVMGRALNLPNISRIGVGMSADPGHKALRQIEELGDVVAYIDDYQKDMRRAIGAALEHKSTPPLLKPGGPSPRSRTHRLILPTVDSGPSDYHVHASEHPPPNVFEQVMVDVFQTIPEGQEEAPPEDEGLVPDPRR